MIDQLHRKTQGIEPPKGGITSSQDIPSDFYKFNHLIGMPKHPLTQKDTIFYEYERKLLEDLQNKHIKNILVNKSRQIGISEFMLRVVAWWAFNKYKGKEIMMVAQREKHTVDLLRRFRKIIKPIDGHIVRENATEIEFDNNTLVAAYPSNSEAYRGRSNVGAIFLDEAAHFNDINDEPILEGLVPTLSTTNGHLVMVSTPHGLRGFFSRIYHEHDPREWRVETLPYSVALGEESGVKKLLDYDFILQQKAQPLFEQEYNCQFFGGAMNPLGEPPKEKGDAILL